MNLVRALRVPDANGDVAVEGTVDVVPAFAEDGPQFRLFTLEREAVIIPADTYTVKLTVSARVVTHELWTPLADHRLPELMTVPNRSGIRIHALNEARQSQGCIGVGRSRSGASIVQSRVALTDLCNAILSAEGRDEDVHIVIIDEESDHVA